MSDFLSRMAESSRRRADEARRGAGAATLTSRARDARPALPLDLSEDGFDLIAEAKLASPADGRLVPEGSGSAAVVKLARSYETAGALAVSVLTEPDRFDGSLAHLEAAADAVDIPILRKDFLVDPIQILEARASGASGVLLIARMVSGETLTEMTDQALSLGMFVLIEVFDESDLAAASVVFARNILIGVNTRDLTTLGVDASRLKAMAPRLPENLPAVAESGIHSPDDAIQAVRLGYRLALVGTGLVTSADPGAAAGALISAGRRAAGIGTPL